MKRSDGPCWWRCLLGGAVFCGMAAGGCASGRTYVLDAAASHPIHRDVVLRRAESGVPVEEGLAREFEAALERQLSREASIETSEDAELQVRYRFVLWDRGNAALRVGSGLTNLLGSPFYGAGDGAVAVDVVYTDREGRVLGRIVADGPIAGAFGSTSDGIDVLAASVAEYTREHFVAPADRRPDSLVHPADPALSLNPAPIAGIQ